jgi:hypothetical protein
MAVVGQEGGPQAARLSLPKPLRTTLQRSGMLIADERKSQPPRMLVGTKDHVRYSEDASYVFSHMIISPEILRRIVGEP